MIVGLTHIGISVSNLERSIDFYRSALDLVLTSQSTFATGHYEGKYESILGLNGATGRVAVVENVSIHLELFEFAYPKPRRNDPNRPVCDHGITHFCVKVSDIDSEYTRLVALGVRFHCQPQKVLGKAAATYARDPDGNVFELLEVYKPEVEERSASPLPKTVMPAGL